MKIVGKNNLTILTIVATNLTWTTLIVQTTVPNILDSPHNPSDHPEDHPDNAGEGLNHHHRTLTIMTSLVAILLTIMTNLFIAILNFRNFWTNKLYLSLLFGIS